VTRQVPKDLARDIAAVMNDPVAFARGFLNADPWEKPAEIMRAIARPHAKVAVKACHSSAKTWTAARIALWFLARFDDAIVVTTAPTWPQVEKLLWGEIHAAMRQGRIKWPKANTTELNITPPSATPGSGKAANYALGLSTNEGVRFQGFHSGHLLFILDEAPGVRPDIWEAIEGARAGGDVRVLAIGNPVIGGGPFYSAFTTERGAWKTFTISAFDTPNLQGVTLDDLKAMDADDPRLDVSPRSYLTTRRWVREKWFDWGVHGSPLWDSRVGGAFPAADPLALLALTWIEQSRTVAVVDRGDPVTIGVDVAGPGEDETVLVVRQGSQILAEQWWPIPDPRGELLAFLAPYRGRIQMANVDACGIGYYLGLHLQDQGIPVNLVNVGESSTDPERYKNLKAEHYWGLRMRFEAGDVVGPMSEIMVEQLTTIRQRPNARGQVEIESKDAAKRRGVKHSPDRAEALMLAFITEPLGGATLSAASSHMASPVRFPREEFAEEIGIGDLRAEFRSWERM
jgi:phage terminase large subunit